MLKKLAKALFSFLFVAIAFFLTTNYFHKTLEDPFETYGIPGKDHSFVFIVTAYNAKDHCINTITSILEQTYRDFKVYYIDDGSTDNTYQTAKEFVDKYYSMAPITLIHNKIRRGSAQNTYENIQECENHEIIVQLEGNCFLPDKDILKNFNNLYKVDKVWLAYGNHLETTTNTLGKCKKPCDQTFFVSMRKRYWEKPFLKTFYAGLFRQVKLEDFFFKGKFINETFDGAYMFPMMEMAKNRIGYISDVVCHHTEDSLEEDLEKPNFFIPSETQKWICKAKPYQPINTHPGSVNTCFYKKRKADLLIFSFDRPLHLFALLESVHRYMEGLNSISVIYRESSPRFFNAYEMVQKTFKNVRFIKQSKRALQDFKPLVLQATFENSIDASPYIIFSSDDLIVKDHIDISECIQSLKTTGAYLFALRLGKRIKYCCLENDNHEIPYHVVVGKSTFGWQIDESRGDWSYTNRIDMNLYRKVDLFIPLLSIEFSDPRELAKNWPKQKAFFRDRMRERVGLCYDDSKVMTIPMNKILDSKINPVTNEDLLELYDQGLKIDIDSVVQNKQQASLTINSFPKLIERKVEKEPYFNWIDDEKKTH